MGSSTEMYRCMESNTEFRCSARTTNISFPYYFTLVHSDRHFLLYSCHNQEESQLLVLRNSTNTQATYTTWVSQPGRETEQFTCFQECDDLLFPSTYCYDIITTIMSRYTFWLHFVLLDDGLSTWLTRWHIEENTCEIALNKLIFATTFTMIYFLLLTQGKLHWLCLWIWVLFQIASRVHLGVIWNAL